MGDSWFGSLVDYLGDVFGRFFVGLLVDAVLAYLVDYWVDLG